MAKMDGRADAEARRIIADCAQQLAEHGNCQSGSSTLRWAKGLVATHTEFGPAEQDKDMNQDFVLTWVDNDQGATDRIAWALAMADGVTASYGAEIGAELACHAGLVRLLTSRDTPEDKARIAVHSAGDAIGAVVDVIEEDPEHYQPEGMFASTWKYTLREGLLLQTTLTLAWLEDGACYLAMVGDGGAAVDFRRGPQGERKVLAAPNIETSRVCAIGPKNRHVDQLDGWNQVATKDLSMLAVYTDGVGYGIGPDGNVLFQHLDECRPGSDAENVAERLVQEWIGTRAEEFEDNLSLAIVNWD